MNGCSGVWTIPEPEQVVYPDWITSKHAIKFAAEKHAGQKRRDGEPYIHHPMRVATYAIFYIKDEIDPNAIYNIGVLHDVYEDCDVTIEELSNKFGNFVTRHVVELSNVYTKKSYPYLNRKKRKRRELERLSGCTNLTKEIKMLDRYDNLTSIQLATNKQYLEESEELLELLRPSNYEIAALLETKIRGYKEKS